MPATSPNQISSVSSVAALSSASAGLNLAVATAIACVVAVACRWLAPIISHDPAELDGFVFLTVVYWVYSVVGYFASVSKSRRQRRVGWAFSPTSSAHRHACSSGASVRLKA